MSNSSSKDTQLLTNLVQEAASHFPSSSTVTVINCLTVFFVLRRGHTERIFPLIFILPLPTSAFRRSMVRATADRFCFVQAMGRPIRTVVHIAMCAGVLDLGTFRVCIRVITAISYTNTRRRSSIHSLLSSVHQVSQAYLYRCSYRQTTGN